jgi:hypothetical protein
VEGFEDALGTAVLRQVVVDKRNPHRCPRTNVLRYRPSPRVVNGPPQYSRPNEAAGRRARAECEEGTR